MTRILNDSNEDFPSLNSRNRNKQVSVDNNDPNQKASFNALIIRNKIRKKELKSNEHKETFTNGMKGTRKVCKKKCCINTYLLFTVGCRYV